MTSEEYIRLYQKYIAGECTPEDEELLFGYEDNFMLQNPFESEKESAKEKELRRKIYGRIYKTINKKEVNIYKLWAKYAAAILITLSVGITTYTVHKKDLEREQTKSVSVKPPIPIPVQDSSAVMLTLSDGSVISLDNANNGLLTEDGSSKISKTADGEVEYKITNNWGYLNASINKLYVPKGSLYKLILADGTKVWLNSNSTLHYPSDFKGIERLVELSGEAYFEVARNEKMPFVVKTKTSKVQVLGTHFNISAYTDDNIEKTTLTEGSVRISQGGHNVVLKPGQQGLVANKNTEIKVQEVNLKQVLAWKEGYFLFKDDNIKDVMKQISRWYNVDIDYETNTEGKLFGGIYSKSKDLDELLKGLELTGIVKFKIIPEESTSKGRRVIVMD
ncbi:FecR family protein [Pseudopedobacter beijingensis]|uniref:FecR family protein n=1 Tax=Pseudopedobacter beijingensis TaxID=1207056 RepID=A0ABW4IEL9_9SPHI